LGLKEVWIKNDTVNYPTLSFKDRVVSVALSRAKELGFEIVACASTGNLANSVAANAASGGLKSYVFIPADLETGKVLGSLVYGTNVIGIRGTYDEVNRLCSEIAGKYGWAFVNVNIRPYYAEGSKAMGYEIIEQLGWRLPDHVVVPMAGGSLITKIHKSFKEFVKLGLVDEHRCSIHGAQAEGCAPIVNAMKAGADIIKPVSKPQTIVKSLAIGNPADGFYSIQTMKQTGGWAENPNDEEVVAGIRLLAETEGIFAETAGGVTVAATQRLVKSGRIKPGESLVLCITGHGLKTQEAVANKCGEARVIGPSLREFSALLDKKN
jgi:threonine synthase